MSNRCLFVLARVFMWTCVVLALLQGVLFLALVPANRRAGAQRSGDAAGAEWRSTALGVQGCALSALLLAFEVPLLSRCRSGEGEGKGARLPLAVGRRFKGPLRVVCSVFGSLAAVPFILVIGTDRLHVALMVTVITMFGGIFDGLVYGHNENRVGGVGGRGTANFF